MPFGGGLFGGAYRNRFRAKRHSRFSSRIKGLSGLRLPTPENTARQRRAGIREYIKIFDCWKLLYQPAGKSEAQQGASYIRELDNDFPASPGQAEPVAVRQAARWTRLLQGAFSREAHVRLRQLLCFSAFFSRFQTHWKASASGFQMKPGQKGTPCKPGEAGCMGRRRRPGAQPKKKQPLSERLLFLSRAEGAPTLELLAGLEPATC